MGEGRTHARQGDVSVEDLFDNTRDRWQRSYRYPLTLRLVWLLGVAAIAAAVVFRGRLEGIFEQDPRIGYGVAAVLALFVFACFWTSLRAWECKILISPTSIKAQYLLRGRERISWDSMAQVVGKWRLLGHSLTLVGTDGAKVRLRSSIRNYDEILGFIRKKAPAAIVQRLEAFLEDEELEEEQPDETDEEAEPEPVPPQEKEDDAVPEAADTTPDEHP
jgi:hypothetical protein